VAFLMMDPQPHYLLQADAFLHGRLDINPNIPGMIDVALFDGRAYVVFPPGPALVLLPLVAIFGVGHTNAILFGLLLASLTILTAYRLLSRMGVGGSTRVWYLAAFALGTGFWFAVLRSSQVWYLAHVVAVLFMMLALSEALGGGRPLLAGSYLGMALLSRQLAIFLIPLITVLFWERARSSGNQIWRVLFRLSAPIVLAGAGMLAFNWARFGSVLDSGYGHIQLSGFLAQRVAEFGLFSLHYLPFNLMYMFIQGWHATFAGPDKLHYLSVDPFGTSLLVASPFLVAALWAKARPSVKWSAWLGIVAAMVVMLLYYNNGMAQANVQRFSLDILPALFFLMVKASSRVNMRLLRAAIVYAVTLNVLTLILFPPLI